MEESFVVLKVKRRDDPDGLSYWERFEVPYETGMTVAGALLKVLPYLKEGAEDDDVKITPPSFERSCLEGSCGACAMLINGKPKLACETLVEDISGVIVLEPLSKFGVIKDLIVDRSSMISAVGEFHTYAEFDGIEFDLLKKNVLEKNSAGDFDGCLMCGICGESCSKAAAGLHFAGAFLMARAASLELNPYTGGQSSHRIASLAQKGGVADCLGLSISEEDCPAQIPLVSAVSVVGKKTLTGALADFFQKV